MKVALLWLVIGAIWIALHPDLRLPRYEALPLFLAFFFFTGLQKFYGDREMMKQAAEHNIPVPFGETRLSRLWMKWRDPIFAWCGTVCIGLFAFLHLRRP